MKIELYHNPRCSKSRAVLALLQDRGLPYELVEYLDNPPNEDDLNHLLEALDQPPQALIRAKESGFKALNLDVDDLSVEQVVDLLLQHPKWLQRPIVVVDGRARIGRPIENVESILP